MSTSLLCVAVGVAAVGASACGETDSNTGLNPDGPPMIRQVFVLERVTNAEGMVNVRSGMAFGDHPDFTREEDDRVVNEAIASTNLPIRVVFDELLVGNELEELLCANGTYAKVPLDADPDDIRDCSPGNLELGNCTAVCANADGIKDENQDGAPDPDGRRMIAPDPAAPETLVVQLVCDGTNIPLDPLASFYSPSGNQQITAGPLGINSLGPAVILSPVNGMRTGAECTLAFNASVVDKDNNQPCTPADGDINNPCTPGDVSLVKWNTEVLALNQSDPGPDATGVSVTTGVGTTKDFTLLFNSDIAMASLPGAFELIEDPAGATPVDRSAELSATLNENDASNVTLTLANPLLGDTDYELRFTTTLTDVFGGPLPQASTLSFTTGMGVPAPDASTIDAAVF